MEALLGYYFGIAFVLVMINWGVWSINGKLKDILKEIRHESI